jgi:hypothetical protein
VDALLSTVQRLPDDARVEFERTLVPIARRAAAGALAVDIAHDAGNALFGLVGLIGLIVADEPIDADRQRLLAQAAGELDATLTPLLQFVRCAADDGASAELGGAVRDGLGLYRHGRRKLLPIETALAEAPVQVACPPSLALQAVVHLLLAADPVESISLTGTTLRVTPARDLSLDELAAARIAADEGGTLERDGPALTLRLPPA